MKWPVSKSLSLICLAFATGLSLYASQTLPDVPLATHFNAQGVPDGFMPRNQALWFGPILLLIMIAFFWILPIISPKNARLERSDKAYGVAWISLILILGFAHFYIVAHAFDRAPDAQWMRFLPGILLIVLGNYLPKVRYNYVLGVRTPWSLSDERVWDRTHQFSGPVFMLAGLMILMSALFVPLHLFTSLLLTFTLGAALICLLASFIFSRRLNIR
ncbi:MAG: SdpI family protein [Asticcacaulis sp.]